jgi:hypothetical protein
MMKKILIFAIFCLLLSGVVSAYEIRIDTPQSIQLGEIIVVNGTTSLPAGVSIDIRLTRSEYTAEVKDTKHVTVQGDKNFSVEFPTTGFTKGVYKVEILPTGEYRYLGDSITMRVITLVDRSDEVKMTSLPVQYMNGVLHLAGSANNVKNSAVEVQVNNPDGTVLFGPAFIPTNLDGMFSKDFQIGKTGIYQVQLTDQKGYIGTYNITVLDQDISATPVTTAPPAVSQTLDTRSSTLSASLLSTRDQPAYFSVTTGQGPVRVYTSSGTDWVIEYNDPSGQRAKINTKGPGFPEEITVQGNGEIQYFMVYPNKYSDQANVTIFAENAKDISVSHVPPPGFVSATTVPQTTSKGAPFPAVMVIIAIGLIVLLWKRK